MSANLGQWHLQSSFYSTMMYTVIRCPGVIYGHENRVISARGKKKFFPSRRKSELWREGEGGNCSLQKAGHSCPQGRAAQVAPMREKEGITRTGFEPSLLAVIFRNWRFLGKSVPSLEGVSGVCWGKVLPGRFLVGSWRWALRDGGYGLVQWGRRDIPDRKASPGKDRQRGQLPWELS